MNPDDEFFEQLRNANPYVTAVDSPLPQTSQRARFEEITMNIPTDVSTTRHNPATAQQPWWRRPLVAAPTALAAVALVAVAALVVSVVQAPSAYALVNEAATNAASNTSGRAVVTIEIREIENDDAFPDGGATVVIDHRYDGDDYSTVQDFSDFLIDGEDEVLSGFEVRVVDGSVYTSVDGLADGRQFFESDPEDEDDIWSALGFGLNPETITASALTGLLEETTDVSEVTSSDGTTTYRATITNDAINRIGADNLPIGLSLLASEQDNGDVPDALPLTIVVRDEVLQEISVEMVGETPTEGFVDATITTVFSEFGEPQSIAAPPADQIASQEDVIGEFGEIATVLSDLEARRPGLCMDVLVTAEPEDPTEFDFDPEEVAAAAAEYEQCLRDAGESGAADAWAQLYDETLDMTSN